jgi:hypothetical protein
VATATATPTGRRGPTHPPTTGRPSHLVSGTPATARRPPTDGLPARRPAAVVSTGRPHSISRNHTPPRRDPASRCPRVRPSPFRPVPTGRAAGRRRRAAPPCRAPHRRAAAGDHTSRPRPVLPWRGVGCRPRIMLAGPDRAVGRSGDRRTSGSLRAATPGPLTPASSRRAPGPVLTATARTMRHRPPPHPPPGTASGRDPMDPYHRRARHGPPGMPPLTARPQSGLRCLHPARPRPSSPLLPPRHRR